MDQARWSRVQRLFSQAVSLEESQRLSFLRAACSGDEALLEEVRSLLAADGSVDEPMTAIYDMRLQTRADTADVAGAIGPYRIERRLGAGGMGVVYKALDTRLDRPVVLKFLSQRVVDPSTRARFMQEARAASRLNHPAICTIYDVGETEDGRLYIAMAYYDGRTLEEVVLRGGVSLSEALAVVGQLADGLALAHGQGIVHRDVKPANIVVGNDGRAVLLDFGIAKLNGSNLTGTGVRLGTLAYMSPQRLRGEADEELCDIWSLGVILFEMISGTRPFVGTEPHEVMTSILEQEPPALTRYVSDVPQSLVAVLRRALAKPVGERFQSMHAFALAVDAVRQELGVARVDGSGRASSTSLIAARVPDLLEDVGVGAALEPRDPTALVGPGPDPRVARFLQGLGLEKLLAVFARNEIDLQTLRELSDADLKELGVLLGPRRRILRALAEWQGSAPRGALTVGSMPGSQAERRRMILVHCEPGGALDSHVGLDPEELSALLQRLRTACARIARRRGARLNQLAAGGVQLSFGYPHAAEDDLIRANQAALEIAALSRDDSAPEHDGDGEPWRAAWLARVGLARGEVVVRPGLTEATDELEIVGTPPAVAAVLAQRARPGEILVEIRSKAAESAGFVYAPGPAVPLGTDSIRSWRLLEALAPERRQRLQRQLEVHKRLVGRDDALAEIDASWRKVCMGRGRAVVVHGDAGLGKSSLVDAFQATLGAPRPVSIRFFGERQYAHSAFHPIIARLRRLARLESGDSMARRARKIERMFAANAVQDGEAVALVCELLDIEHPSTPGAELSARRRRLLLMQCFERELHAVASDRPVLMVIEDLQWLDPSTLELLGNVMTQLADLKLLVLCTHRPSFTPPWLASPRILELPLQPLPPPQASGLVGEILAMPVEAALVRQVVERSAGNPLYLWELSKSVKQSLAGAALTGTDGADRATRSGAPQQGGLPVNAPSADVLAERLPIRVPDSLHDSLLARMDGLGAARRFLQLAAVIGPRFSYELFSSVSEEASSSVLDGLDVLVRADLLSVHGIPPQASYEFSHALLQDVAYETLLKGTRRALHERIAMTIEARFPELLRSQPELLAVHFAQADKHGQALTYLRRAATRAMHGSAYEEAIALLKRGLVIADRIEDPTERQRWQLTLLTDLGPGLLATRGYAAEEAAGTYERAASICASLAGVIGDGPELAAVLRGQRVFRLLRAEYGEALRLGARLLSLGRRQQNPTYRLEAHLGLGMGYLFTAHFDEALRHLRLARDIYRDQPTGPHAQRFGSDSGAAALAYAGRSLWFLGYADEALRYAREAVGLTTALGHPFSQVQALCMLANVHQVRAEPTEAADAAQQAMALAAEQGFPYWGALAQMLYGWAEARLHDPLHGVEQLRAGMQAYEATGARLGRSWFLCLLAEAQSRADLIGPARRSLERARQAMQRTGERYHAVDVHRMQAELELRGGDVDRASTWLQQALAIAQGQNARVLERQVLKALLRLHQTAPASLDQPPPVMVPAWRSALNDLEQWFASEPVSTLGRDEV